MVTVERWFDVGDGMGMRTEVVRRQINPTDQELWTPGDQPEFQNPHVLDNNARVQVQHNGKVIAARRAVNLIDSASVTLSPADNIANESVDVSMTTPSTFQWTEVTISASATVSPTSSSGGTWYNVTDTGTVTFTLPRTNTLTTHYILAISKIISSAVVQGDVVVNVNAADAVNGGTAGTGFTIHAGEWAILTTDAAGNWYVSRAYTALGKRLGYRNPLELNTNIGGPPNENKLEVFPIPAYSAQLANSSMYALSDNETVDSDCCYVIDIAGVSDLYGLDVNAPGLIRRVKLKSNSTPGNKVTIYDVQQATIGINVDGYAGLDLGNPNSSITVVSGPQVPAYLVALVGSPTGGTYTLTVTFQGGVTVGGTIGGATSNIAYNANAATIQAALRNVPGCGNVTVTGTLGSGFTVTFPDTFDSVGNSGVTVTINASGLTGGTYSLNQTLSSATCQWYVLARDPGDRLWHGVAASFTCPACEAVYGFDLSAAGYTATLPTVNLYKGLRIGFVVEKIVSSGPPNSLTISGAPSGSPAIFANLNSFIFYEYDGTQWQVVGISAGNEMYTGLAANFTAPACQAVYGMDCSAASRTVTMPSTNLYVGLRIGFTVQKNTALPYANSLTISGLGTVPGGYLNILYGLGYFIFEYDGTQWNVVSIRPASEATEVANSALQSVPTGTPTPLVANTALGQQLFGSWAIGPTPSRLISIQGGIVSITASVSFPSVAAGSLVQVYLRKNGSTQYPIVTPTHTVQTSEVPNGVQMSLAITTSVSIGDYFEVIGLHNLGSAHPVQLTEFSMSRLGA